MKFSCILISIFMLNIAWAQDGLIKTYYSGGAVESEINFKNNIRDGEAKFYYENGNLREERRYINGRIEGLIRIYYENGRLKEQFNIETGKREGTTTYFSEDGEFIADADFTLGRKVIPETVLPEETMITGKIKTEPVQKENNFKKTESFAIPPSLEDTMEDDPAFFSTAEVMPQPAGGMSAIYKRLVYPREAKAKQIEGTVKILAYIDEWGDVTQAEVTEGIGYGCDEAARTTIYYTKFSPGLIKGKPVKMRIVVPVEFKLPTP